jgi:oligopeptidase B
LVQVLTTEYRILNSDNPDGICGFQPRVRGLEYSISHFGILFILPPIKAATISS